jgi:hypothetical protein
MTETDEEPRVPVRTVPWFGPLQRAKASYQRLHPSAQMIGLQLWLPFAFVLLFVLCYINAFHAPAPHDQPIGVVGTPAAARQWDATLEKAVPGGYTVRTVAPSDTAAALQQVRSGDLAALYAPSAHGAGTLTYATANGVETSEFALQTFQGVTAGSGAGLAIHDLAPLPSNDLVGTDALYVSLVSIITGYLTGMFCGMLGGPLRRRTRWGILIGAAAVFSLIITLLVEYVVGALHGHFWELWATLGATSLSVGLVVDALGYFLNRFVTGAALTLFVFLNIPSSGGAMPVAFVPEPFRWLHNVVIGNGLIDIVRAIFYQVGPGAHVGVLRLVYYAAAGIVLALFGPHFAAWRHRRRTLLGLPLGGMMGHAQHQLMLAATTKAAADEEPTEGEDASGSAVEGEAALEQAG